MFQMDILLLLYLLLARARTRSRILSSSSSTSVTTTTTTANMTTILQRRKMHHPHSRTIQPPICNKSLQLGTPPQKLQDSPASNRTPHLSKLQILQRSKMASHPFHHFLVVEHGDLRIETKKEADETRDCVEDLGQVLGFEVSVGEDEG
ncbi:MAG: hypothetical protein J3R72DRAFT_434094 [Linnemannia gamsii]|nr:MAG: hypothetical protein J3R72DRAFT_434094 [Linnemannia gamsii]